MAERVRGRDLLLQTHRTYATLQPYLNYTLSEWITPIDDAQLSCSCPTGQSDKQAVCFLLRLHLVLLRV